MLKKFAKKKLISLHQKAMANLHEMKYLFLELTHRCNNSCLHCGSDCVRNDETPDLPKDAILRVLNEIKAEYNTHEINVVLSGGEPLCYPGLFDLAREIIKLEFPWSMVTNGYAWTQDTINEAKNSGLHTVTVSLDGFGDDHNWLRGVPDSFEKAVNTIKMFVSDPFYNDMDIMTCVNKKNIKTLDSFYNFLKSLGIKKWRITTISPIGRAVLNEDLFLSKEDHIYLFDKIIELKAKDEIQINFCDSEYLGDRYEFKVRDHNFFCQAGISIAGIMLNGDILACPNIDRRFMQGNIYSDSFVDVWENKYQLFRNREWMKTGDCKKCKEWELCKGSSFHLWDIDNNRPKICHSDTQ